MVKKLFVFFIFAFMMVGLSINANALEVNYSEEVSSLEKLASQRLYVYGIIDEVPETFDYQMTRGEAVQIIYNMVLGEKEAIAAPFIDASGEYEKYIDYFYSAGIVNGCSDGLFHPEWEIKQNHFLYILLKSFDPDVTFENLDNKLAELGISKINNDFSAGDIYILLSDFIDVKNLEYSAIRNQISLPAVIEISISSVEDGLNKLRDIFKFGPKKIKVNYECDKDTAIAFYTALLKEEFSSGENILYPELFDSQGGFYFNYSCDIDKNRREDYRKSSNDIWFKYTAREISIEEYLYSRKLNRFTSMGTYKQGIIEISNLDESIFINLNALDWIDCLGDEIESKTIKILSDVEQYRHLSDFEKIEKINEYISTNAEYDYDEYYLVLNYSYGSYNDNFIPHSAIGFITTGKIVCDGYSSTFHWLMNYLDVLTICQNGRVDGMNHEWNKVMLDGEWYNIDVCWNDTGNSLYDYFLKSDKYFSFTHQTRDNFTDKSFDANIDWYRYMEI